MVVVPNCLVKTTMLEIVVIRYKTIGLLIFSYFFFYCPVSWAAPSISGASGTVSDDQTVTINGTGFGTKSPVAPQVWADFSGSGCTASALSYGANVLWCGENMSNVTSAPSPGYAPASGHAMSTTSLTVAGCEVGSHAPLGAPTWTRIYNYYKRYYTYTATANEKMWRMGGGSGQDVLQMCNGPGNTGRIYEEAYDYDYCSSIYGQDGGACVDSTYQGSRPTSGSWHIEEIRWNWTSEHDGLWQYTVDGVQNQLRNNMTNGPNAFNEPFVDALSVQGAPPDGSRVYISDYYIDTTYARVMIGNAATLSASTQREIQIPKTTWNDSQIQVQVNQGSFASGAVAYLFVVDSDNNASAGYRITFGSDSDTTSPNRGFRFTGGGTIR
jgi:hypothetical protein